MKKKKDLPNYKNEKYGKGGGNMKRYRQGDVGLYQVKSIPKAFKKEKGNILALGETSGHMHQFIKGKWQFYTDGIKRYVEVLQPSIINHEEHNQIIIPIGEYEQISEREYDYPGEEIRTVID